MRVMMRNSPFLNQIREEMRMRGYYIKPRASIFLVTTNAAINGNLWLAIMFEARKIANCKLSV